MIRSVQSIDLFIDKYTPKTEVVKARGFICPSCNGSGGFQEEIGRDDYRWKTCPRCDGTGRMRAVVTVDWKADYDS